MNRRHSRRASSRGIGVAQGSRIASPSTTSWKTGCHASCAARSRKATSPLGAVARSWVSVGNRCDSASVSGRTEPSRAHRSPGRCGSRKEVSDDPCCLCVGLSWWIGSHQRSFGGDEKVAGISDTSHPHRRLRHRLNSVRSRNAQCRSNTDLRRRPTVDSLDPAVVEFRQGGQFNDTNCSDCWSSRSTDSCRFTLLRPTKSYRRSYERHVPRHDGPRKWGFVEEH